MSKEVNLELLESYMNNVISADEVLDVEGNVLSSEELTVAVSEYEDTILQLEGVALKRELIQMQDTVSKRTTASKKPWYAMAAVLLFLITAGFLWQILIKAEPEFDDYFEHFNQLVTFRGIDGEVTKGMEAYTRKHYEEAFSLLNKVDEQEGLDSELKFYLAVSALGGNHTGRAIALLEKLDKENGNKYHQQVNWYLALAYWKNEEPERAVSQLEEIGVDQYQYKKATELIDLLK